MSKKQVILSAALMFPIPCLAYDTGPESVAEKRYRKQMIENKVLERHFRYQIYENKLAVTVESKNKAVKVIGDHREKLKRKLENRESFFGKFGRLGLLGLLGVVGLKWAIDTIKKSGFTEKSLLAAHFGGSTIAFLTIGAIELTRRGKIKQLINKLERDNQALEKLNFIQE